jgi:LysR family transcriptional regulator of beta-lactamase
MFTHLLNSERIVQPFTTQIDLGSYWLTRLQSRAQTPAMREFAQWLVGKMQK